MRIKLTIPLKNPLLMTKEQKSAWLMLLSGRSRSLSRLRCIFTTLAMASG